MRCLKCGKKIKSDSSFCIYCGVKIEIPEEHPENAENQRTKLYAQIVDKKKIIVTLAIICFIGYFFSARCDAGICLLPSGFNGEYCIIHTCKIDSCTNKRAAGKSLCYTHSPSTSSNFTYTPEVAKSVLKFSDINIQHNSSYTVCTGKLTNNGKKTYTFIEVKGKFKNSQGIVLDTDWTYAVGSEGLAPEETTTFRLSVDKDYSIKNCSVEILDYEV